MKATYLLLAATAATANSPVSAGLVSTLVDNGPSSNRVDAVFLGDGYTAADITAGTYANHIGHYLNHMFADALNSDPFYRYRNYFNVYSIEVVSNESGADDPLQNDYRDTALDASYLYDGYTDRLLYIDSAKATEALVTSHTDSGELTRAI